jgi:tripartite-type tricarboxylate transporter receptor subunit TctC
MPKTARARARDRVRWKSARSRIWRGAVGAVLGLFSAGSAMAQSSVADFYKGRTIDVYVGLSAGGVYDISARLLSRYMGKYIPGNPAMVTRNMEGAFNALLGLPGSLFEPTKYNWIGSTNDEVSICAAWHTSGVTSIEQLYDKELIVGSTGASGDDEQFPKILNGVLGTKIRTVSGYPGGNEIKMAMQRGEVNGRCGWSWSSVKATEGQWLKDKTISIFVQLSMRKHKDLPDTPMIMDVAKTDEQRQIFKLVFARQVMAWPFAVPPGVPAERVAALRKAFDETLKDPEFLAEAEKLTLEITPVSGERIQNLIAEVYRTTSPEVAAKVGAMLK